MQVLIVGGGGREHALAWKVAQSQNVSRVYCAPGNAGTAAEPKCENVALATDDIAALVEFARTNAIELTIVGPEAPLVAGIVDVFRLAGLKCFGPRRDAAELEGSKAYMKAFLERHAIPTARYAAFDEITAAEAYIRRQPLPVVVKADGLAAGKGVVIATTHEEAMDAARGMLSGEAFGAAGARIVVEEFITGEEVSFIVMTDGTHVVPFASSQDHKARDDGDRGPNTGGMGAYTPAPIVDAVLHERIMREVITPTLTGMAADRRPYQGFLYAGLMITPDGAPKVLEYNCRFGDPETQPIMMRLKSDLAAACIDLLDGRGDSIALDWDERVALGVVVAAGGYPGAYDKGKVITGLDKTSANTKVFHAGTRNEGDVVVTAGGRVLCVVGLGTDVAAAQRSAYAGVDDIQFDGAFCRRDIGYRALGR